MFLDLFDRFQIIRLFPVRRELFRLDRRAFFRLDGGQRAFVELFFEPLGFGDCLFVELFELFIVAVGLVRKNGRDDLDALFQAIEDENIAKEHPDRVGFFALGAVVENFFEPAHGVVRQKTDRAAA